MFKYYYLLIYASFSVKVVHKTQLHVMPVENSLTRTMCLLKHEFHHVNLNSGTVHFLLFLIPQTNAHKFLLTIIVEITNLLLRHFRHTKCHPQGVR